MKRLPLLFFMLVAPLLASCSSIIPVPGIRPSGSPDLSDTLKVLQESSDSVMESFDAPMEDNEKMLETYTEIRHALAERFLADALAEPADKLSAADAALLQKQIEDCERALAGLRGQNQHWAQQKRFAAEHVASSDAYITNDMAFAQVNAAEAEFQTNMAQRSGTFGGLTSIGSNDPRSRAYSAHASQEEAKARIIHAQAEKLESENAVWFLPWTWNLF